MKKICPNCRWFIGWTTEDDRNYCYCSFIDQWIEETTAMDEKLDCDVYAEHDLSDNAAKKP